MFENRNGDRAGFFGVEYARRGWRWRSCDRVAASYDCPGLAERGELRRARRMGPSMAEDKPVGLPEVKVIANTPLAPASPPPAARGARRQGFVGTGSYCGIGGR